MVKSFGSLGKFFGECSRDLVAIVVSWLPSLSFQERGPIYLFLPSCAKDSQTSRDRLIPLHLPKCARMFTFDTVSIYSNIELKPAMEKNEGVA